MTVALEGPRALGARHVGVLTETVIHRTGTRGAAGFAGWKRPLAVLVREGGETRVFPLDRRAGTPERIEALCPGTLAAMARA